MKAIVKRSVGVLALLPLLVVALELRTLQHDHHLPQFLAFEDRDIGVGRLLGEPVLALVPPG